MSDFSRPLVDFKDQRICTPCWNGLHWHRATTVNSKGRAILTSEVVWDCLGKPCQCHCRELYKEQHARRRKIVLDYSNQTVIDTGDDVLEFGNSNTHIDKG